MPTNPRKPEVYNYSFFILPGDEASPVALNGPVQGDSIDHTLFWLPRERIVITGDAVYSRSTHAWVEEIETTDILHAWNITLLLIESLNPTKIISGHIEQGWDFDAKKDMEHMHKYLDLFEQKITKASKKPTVDELFQTFKNAFPACDKNLDFFLGHLSNNFGEGTVARSGKRIDTTTWEAESVIRWKASCWEWEPRSRFAVMQITWLCVSCLVLACDCCSWSSLANAGLPHGPNGLPAWERVASQVASISGSPEFVCSIVHSRRIEQASNVQLN